MVTLSVSELKYDMRDNSIQVAELGIEERASRESIAE